MEFTPTVRGPQTLARTLPLPLPSTIAGCLATLLLDKVISNLPEEVCDSWEDALIQILGLNDEACLRGPYLLVDDEVYVPFGEELIKLRDLFEKFRKINVKEAIYEGKLFRDVLEPIMIRLRKVEHVGIGLEKASKRVKRGLLYSAEFIDYLSTFKGRKVSIALDIHGMTALNKLSFTERYIMRLGGEGKTVRIKISERSYLWEDVTRILGEIESKRECLIYIVSPSLIRTPLTDLTPIITLRRPKFSIGGISLELLAGHINILGAGFDVRHGVRKPMYASLAYGSLLIAKIEQVDLAKLYRHGLSDVGGKLGYGTFIPLPT